MTYRLTDLLTDCKAYFLSCYITFTVQHVYSIIMGLPRTAVGSSTLHPPYSSPHSTPTKQDDFKTSKLALTSHFPMQMQNEKGKKSFSLFPASFIFSENPCCPLEMKPDVQFWGENGLGDPGGCSALPKQTIQQTNN